MTEIRRRDVLRGVAGLGVVCFLPTKEQEPQKNNFVLFGSSTVVDIKNRLDDREMIGDNSSIYVRGLNGGKIDDVMGWLSEDQKINIVTDDVFFMIGGNEVSNTNLTVSQLQIEAEKMGTLANLASHKFPGKKIHFILPQPTLLENRDPDCHYEERRGFFNQKVKEVLKSGTANNPNIDWSPIELDNYVFVTDSNNPEKKIVNQKIFRDERHFTNEMLDKIISLIHERINTNQKDIKTLDRLSSFFARKLR